MEAVIAVVFFLILLIVIIIGAATKRDGELEIKNSHFPSNLLYLRIKYKKEYDDIHNETSIEVETLKDFVSGNKNPTLEELDKLATLFEVTREEMVYRNFKYENKDWYLNDVMVSITEKIDKNK